MEHLSQITTQRFLSRLSFAILYLAMTFAVPAGRPVYAQANASMGASPNAVLPRSLDPPDDPPAQTPVPAPKCLKDASGQCVRVPLNPQPAPTTTCLFGYSSNGSSPAVPSVTSPSALIYSFDYWFVDTESNSAYLEGILGFPATITTYTNAAHCPQSPLVYAPLLAPINISVGSPSTVILSDPGSFTGAWYEWSHVVSDNGNGRRNLPGLDSYPLFFINTYEVAGVDIDNNVPFYLNGTVELVAVDYTETSEPPPYDPFPPIIPPPPPPDGPDAVPMR